MVESTDDKFGGTQDSRYMRNVANEIERNQLLLGGNCHSR